MNSDDPKDMPIQITTSNQIKKMFKIGEIYKILQDDIVKNLSHRYFKRNIEGYSKILREMHPYYNGAIMDHYVEYEIECDFENKLIKLENRYNNKYSGYMGSEYISEYHSRLTTFQLDNELNICSYGTCIEINGNTTKDLIQKYDPSAKIYDDYEKINELISDYLKNSDKYMEIVAAVSSQLEDLLDDYETGRHLDASDNISENEDPSENGNDENSENEDLSENNNDEKKIVNDENNDQ